jgi:hypothetical protein
MSKIFEGLDKAASRQIQNIVRQNPKGSAAEKMLLKRYIMTPMVQDFDLSAEEWIGQATKWLAANQNNIKTNYPEIDTSDLVNLATKMYEDFLAMQGQLEEARWKGKIAGGLAGGPLGAILGDQIQKYIDDPEFRQKVDQAFGIDKLKGTNQPAQQAAQPEKTSGRQLSQTPDAIRKREQRAAAKAAQATDKPVTDKPRARVNPQTGALEPVRTDTPKTTKPKTTRTPSVAAAPAAPPQSLGAQIGKKGYEPDMRWWKNLPDNSKWADDVAKSPLVPKKVKAALAALGVVGGAAAGLVKGTDPRDKTTAPAQTSSAPPPPPPSGGGPTSSASNNPPPPSPDKDTVDITTAPPSSDTSIMTPPPVAGPDEQDSDILGAPGADTSEPNGPIDRNRSTDVAIPQRPKKIEYSQPEMPFENTDAVAVPQPSSGAIKKAAKTIGKGVLPAATLLTVPDDYKDFQKRLGNKDYAGAALRGVATTTGLVPHFGAQAASLGAEGALAAYDNPQAVKDYFKNYKPTSSIGRGIKEGYSAGAVGGIGLGEELDEAGGRLGAVNTVAQLFKSIMRGGDPVDMDIQQRQMNALMRKYNIDYKDIGVKKPAPKTSRQAASPDMKPGQYKTWDQTLPSFDDIPKAGQYQKWMPPEIEETINTPGGMGQAYRKIKLKPDEMDEGIASAIKGGTKRIATMRKYFAGDETAKDPTDSSIQRAWFADPKNQYQIQRPSQPAKTSKTTLMTPEDEMINELSPETLASYKKKAGAEASAADKEGDFQKGNKRFSGINRATRLQFKQDAKKGKAEKVNELSPKTINAFLDKASAAVRGGRPEPAKINPITKQTAPPGWKVAAGKVAKPGTAMDHYAKVKAIEPKVPVKEYDANLIKQIAAANQIKDPNLIYIGQKIRLPSGDTYVVQKGDTLSDIIYNRPTQSEPINAPVAPVASIPKVEPKISNRYPDSGRSSGSTFVDPRNNPGNLRGTDALRRPGYVLDKAVGFDKNGFAIFANPEDGKEAMRRQLALDALKRGLTGRQLIHKYAPPVDNNDTNTYIKNTFGELGLDPDSKISAKDLDSIQRLMVRQEHGKEGMKHYFPDVPTNNIIAQVNEMEILQKFLDRNADKNKQDKPVPNPNAVYKKPGAPKSAPYDISQPEEPVEVPGHYLERDRPKLDAEVQKRMQQLQPQKTKESSILKGIKGR